MTPITRRVAKSKRFTAILQPDDWRNKTMFPRKTTGKAKVIAVAARKGGACKTTDSVNVAAWFALRGYKTLFLEVDDNSKAYTVLIGPLQRNAPPLDKSRTTYALFYTQVEDPDGNIYSVHQAVYRLTADELLNRTSINKGPLETIKQERGWATPSVMDMIPGTPSLRAVEKQYAVQEFDDTSFRANTQFRDGVDPLRDEYDIIVVDTPPTLTTILFNVLVLADYMFVPVELFPSSVYDYDETMRSFMQVQGIRNTLKSPPLVMLGVVANRDEGKAGQNQVYAEYTEPHEDPETRKMVPPNIPYTMLARVPLDSDAVDAAERLRIPHIIQAPAKPFCRALAQLGMSIERGIGL